MGPRTHAACAAALALALLAACGGGGAPAGASIEPGELAARLGSDGAPLVLDVRTPEEFAAGHIPGSVNIPYDALPDRLTELSVEPDEEIVVHCERGGRASSAEAVLRDAGYTRVLDLEGHMQEWRAGGYPVE